ncbi:MAG: DUF421 domain-containing protein [Anaerolineae bacterium]|nr:DUF421 domain-containing protein [Anaerolineae bacterium]
MENYTFDLNRIFIGELPILFIVEIALRTTIMMLYLMFLLRLLGRRSMTQLSLFEFVLIIGLGSAVGDPMFYFDIPVIHGMAAITFVVFIERALIWLTNRSHKVEDILEGTPKLLVQDGEFDVEGVNSVSMSRNEIYMELRLVGVEQLGQVKISYLEMNGEMSIFKHAPKDVRPGLPLLPGTELGKAQTLPVDQPVAKTGDYACLCCGSTVSLEAGQALLKCKQCDDHKWIEASHTGVREENDNPEPPLDKR